MRGVRSASGAARGCASARCSPFPPTFPAPLRCAYLYRKLTRATEFIASTTALEQSIAAKQALAEKVAAEHAAQNEAQSGLRTRCDATRSEREAVEAEAIALVATRDETTARMEAVQKEAAETSCIAKCVVARRCCT